MGTIRKLRRLNHPRLGTVILIANHSDRFLIEQWIESPSERKKHIPPFFPDAIAAPWLKGLLRECLSRISRFLTVI
jgi:hypothetical protein